MSGKNLVLEIFWKRLSANQIAPFFKSQYLMNFLSRYVHILHGGRPYWEEVIDLFYDVTCLPKHARACPYRTEIALSPIILLNNVYFFNHKSVQLSVLHNPAKTACLRKIWFSRYFKKGSQPIRLPRFSDINISWTS